MVNWCQICNLGAGEEDRTNYLGGFYWVWLGSNTLYIGYGHNGQLQQRLFLRLVRHFAPETIIDNPSTIGLVKSSSPLLLPATDFSLVQNQFIYSSCFSKRRPVLAAPHLVFAVRLISLTILWTIDIHPLQWVHCLPIIFFAESPVRVRTDMKLLRVIWVINEYFITPTSFHLKLVFSNIKF